MVTQSSTENRLRILRQKIARALIGPHLLAFLPAICLASFWLVGEGGLMLVALAVPSIWAMLNPKTNLAWRSSPLQRPASILPRDEVTTRVETLLSPADPSCRTAIFALALETGETPLRHLGAAALFDLREQMTQRLRTLLRTGDLLLLIDEATWIIALSPGPRLDLAAAIQQASRLQEATDDPLLIGQDRQHVISTVGFHLVHMAERPNTPKAIDNALQALTAAQLAGAGSIRAYSPQAMAFCDSSHVIIPNAPLADHGKITAWFQPQVSTETGAVCGFEALARLHDPKQGTLLPPSFLPKLEAAGQLEALSEVMLAQALEALCSWDKAGLSIDTIGVNYSGQDLSNPRLYDTIAWELDRRDINPSRLCVEILESVIAPANENIVTHNVTRLADLGCRIDLDDFGTGHSSISTLKQLPVSRIKIDRSFVARVDMDSDQQRMAATILMMAERLGLQTLAEGVETVGEHAILAQLGCQFVQGYGIAKPMPLDQTADWTRRYQARVQQTPSINRETGS